MKKVLAVVLALLMTFGCFSVISFAEEATDHLTEVPDGYVGVYTKDDLDYIRLDMSGKYILMNDIVFEDKDFEKGGDFYNSGKGWEPIGTSSTNFKGTFDGNGYAIKNLYINAPEQDYVGLFGYISNSTIQNFKLENTSITGSNYTGGIVGYATNCIVQNCKFSGLIAGVNYVGGIVGLSHNTSTVSFGNVQGVVKGVDYVGGIVGYQKGYKDWKGSDTYNYIVYCNNSAHINASSNVGGIVGYSESESFDYYNYNNHYYDYEFAYVKECSNSGSVVATASNAGGIVGCSTGFYADTFVESCYNCGDIIASNYAGGLVGNAYIYSTIVTKSYSIGIVSAVSNFGGCFGCEPKTVTFCYYLDESVTEPSCTSGTPKSADQLRRATAYEQWDFTNVWTREGREDYPYPELINTPLVLPGDLHEHDYKSEVTIPATHLKTGVMTYTCECGDSYTEKIEKTPGHSYTSKVTTPATHTSTGVMTYICECGDSYTEIIDKLADHSHNAVVTEPTCTEGGYTTYTCACGDSYVSDYVDALGHTDGDWVVTKPATTTQTGTKTQSCSVCGKLLKTETIPMLPAKVHSVSVSGVSLDYKSTGTIATAINADTGAKYTVTYSSSNSTVASVDANGKVTAGKTGNATITCTVTDEYGNVVTDTCEVKVSYNWWQWIIVIVLFGWIWY